jgi:hypothetical protein
MHVLFFYTFYLLESITSCRTSSEFIDMFFRTFSDVSFAAKFWCWASLLFVFSFWQTSTYCLCSLIYKLISIGTLEVISLETSVYILTYGWNKLDHFIFVSMMCVLAVLVPWRFHGMYQIEDMRGNKLPTHTLQILMCCCTINWLTRFDSCLLPSTFLCFVCET